MGNSVSIPFSGYIQGGVNYNSNVLIVGMPLHHCQSFSINLCAGPTYDSDTAFHFNPRFNDGRVVRNHKQGGSWGMEETKGGLPFHKGHNFELRLSVGPQGYKVSINHKPFCTFNHRIPMEKVQYLYITGDVAIVSIQQNHSGSKKFSPHGNTALPPSKKFSPHGNTAPPPYPGLPAYPSYPGGACPPPIGLPTYPSYPPSSSGPLYNPPTPLVTPIPGGLYTGKIIYITGTPRHGCSRFTVNLACGADDSADVALHFDVRVRFGDSTNVVVRTHKANNAYGHEERHQNYFPFTPGVNFEMMILTEQSGFKVAVNNQHFIEFFHRIQPFQRVNYLNIVGDVTLSQVRFQ